ncbi:peroxidase [Marchantia polymorpha subsp. ruderalis]|uniref:Peroxidase n=2 Tax=Marchantia polymorpha TaxID=3197 RepID=A0A176VP94_MARPO|nr:hypothetical protein AXG93_2550s1330 [Marchantia polymorpha subsp. ruderalis]PTQ46971.1 hypothetical protein MARPO_0009s0083 [Marchantia polymorpha]BBN17366.1 hypothetical protein Mp_7g13980 [Marchantia polymorpha subsp. ruderalis]|eukprot:PTQ46971.1 hypothetical protein MARPO_0009s0083 [Marchantia polymorpha]
MGRGRGSSTNMGLAQLSVLWLLSWQFQGLMIGVTSQVLSTTFYDFTCPVAEQLVQNTVQQAFLLDNTITAAIIRLLFHDCFVNGCDASIMLAGLNSEQVAVPNLTVRGYDVINNAKVQIEAVCPGIVSCSDIIVLAARDSVGLLGGPTYDVALGRLDGLGPGNVVLPTPSDTVATSIGQFLFNGLTVADMVVLLGAHSVGQSQCQFFNNRLYNFNNSGFPDPSLNATFLATLQGLCPQNGSGNANVPLDDQTEFVLDTDYYRTILDGRGLLTIDQDLVADAGTRNVVDNLAGRASDLNLTFSSAFVAAMDKMSRIGLKTLIDGQVRRVCSAVN